MNKPGETSSEEQSWKIFSKVAECLYRNKSSSIYYGLVKRGGKQFRRSLKTTDRKLAERRLVALRQKVGGLTQSKTARAILFGDLADKWLESVKGGMKPSSVLRRQVCINQLKPIFGDVVVRNFDSENCNDWVQKRGSKLSAQSFNIERETLSHILEYAKQNGLLLENPAFSIKRRKSKKSKPLIPTRSQFSQIIDAVRNAYSSAKTGGDLLELLAYSGMRLGEATALTWGDIDFDRGSFTVTGGEKGTKNNEARSVPLFPAMRELLEKIRDSKVVSPSDRIIPIDTAKKALANACEKSGLPYFHHHCLRHYFVSNAIEAGVDFKVIASWVGHKDGGVLVAKTYGHLRDTHSFDMAKRMVFTATDTKAS